MSLRRVLIAGARGQVGLELQQTAPTGTEVIGLNSPTLDIGNRTAVLKLVEELRPSLIINAAAYTAVDKAESEPALAMRVNGEGAGNLAEAAQRAGARMLHISTDFVFDGQKSSPYLPTDSVNPINVYGASKLKGEELVRERSVGTATILRTAWVYAAHGRNFVKTMLNLLTTRDELRVVADQVGTPTSAGSLASALWALGGHNTLSGIYHFTDAGVASWFDFAVAIKDIAALTHPGPLAQVTPVRTEDFPTAARRPPYSVLDKTATIGIIGPSAHWRTPLQSVVHALSHKPETS